MRAAEQRGEGRAAEPVAQGRVGTGGVALTQQREPAIEAREVRARMGRIRGDDALHHLAPRREVPRLQGQLRGEQERVGRAGVVGLGAHGLQQLAARVVLASLLEVRPRQRRARERRLRIGRELHEHAAQRGARRHVVAGLIRRLGLQEQRGQQQLRPRSRLGVEQRRQIGHGLVVLADFEIDARLPHGGLTPHRRAGGHLLGQLELRARFVAVALRPTRLALHDQHPGARGGIEIGAEQLLINRFGIDGVGGIERAAREPEQHRIGERRAPRAQRGHALARAGPVARGHQRQRQSRGRPFTLRAARVRAERGHGLRRVAGGERPPRQSQPARGEQRVRAALRELAQHRLGARGLADSSERVAVPEEDVARDRRRHATRLHLSPFLVGLFPPAERIERQREPVASPCVERRRRRPGQQHGERVACAARFAQPQRRPAGAVHRPRTPFLPGRLLRDLPEEPVGLLGAVQSPQRLGQPVARLLEQLAFGALAHGVVERLGRVVEVAALKACAPALERLAGDAEPRAHTRQRARRLHERGGLLGGGRCGDRGRERGQLDGRWRQRQLGRERRLLGRRLRERDEARQVGRRRLGRARRRGADECEPDEVGEPERPAVRGDDGHRQEEERHLDVLEPLQEKDRLGEPREVEGGEERAGARGRFGFGRGVEPRRAPHPR